MSDYAGAPAGEVNQPTPRVGGWLLYFCVSLTILGPAAMVGWIQKTPSPLMTAVYASLALTSFVAEITTWAKMSSAFLWLKIALVMRLLYAIFQSYLATKAARGPSTNSDFVKQEITSATVNIFLISVLYFYFRFSSRVQEIFGRNISRSEKIRPRCESPSPAPSTASIHNSSNEKI